MKNMVRTLLAAVLTASLILAFGSCRRSSNKIAPDGTVTLQYWSIYPLGDTHTPWMLSKIAQFEENNPHIKIEHTGISFWDYFTKINVSINDPNGPDVFFHTVTDNAARASGGLLLDLSPYFSPDVLSPGDFSDMDREALSYRDGIYGVPVITDGRVLYYNKDILNELIISTDQQWRETRVGQKAGTTIFGKPADLLDANGDVRAPVTWDEMAAYSELLTIRNAARRITRLGFDLGIGNNTIMNIIWTHGGRVFDDNQRPVVNTDPGVRTGYEIWYELARIHPIQDVNAFVSSTAGTADTMNLFWQQAVGMMIATNEVPWQNLMMSPENRVNLGAATIPYINGNRYNFSGGFSLEITSRLRREDPRVAQAAYDFLAFLMSDEVQRELLIECGSMPGKLSIYEELTAALDDPAKKVVIEEMAFRRPFDYVPSAPQWWGPIFESLIRYVQGSWDLERSLNEAQTGIERIQRTH